MDRIEDINPDRIRWCCVDRGIALEELAGQVGIAASTWERFLQGGQGLTFRQLRDVAQFFNRGVLFFLEPGGVDEKRLRSPQFRTLAGRRADLFPEIEAIIERVEAQRELYLGLLEDLGDDSAPKFSPPNVADQNEKQSAAIVRTWLGLGEQNTFEGYRRAVEDRGVLVFRSMGYQGKWRIPRESSVVGFSLFDERCPVIFVRQQRPEPRQTFTLVHELGHLLLHRDSFIDDEDDLLSLRGRERAANAFAGFVLVPDEQLKEIDDSLRPRDAAEFAAWLRPHADRWGVSVEVVLRRLMDSGRLERSQYDAYRAWCGRQPVSEQDVSSRQWRSREPLHIFGRRFVRTVLDSLHARQITLNKAGAYLDNLKVKDIHALEAHLANV